MPVITLEGGRMSREKKADLVRELTEVASRHTGIAAQAFVIVIKENDAENIGVGGTLLADRTA